MPRVVRAFPLRSSRSELESFAAQLKGQRASDAVQFFQHYGVRSESWHLQDTPNGPWVIAITEMDDPKEAAPRFAGAVADFDVWFKSQVLAVTGIDLNTAPLGPPTTEVFGWSDSASKKGLDRDAELAPVMATEGGHTCGGTAALSPSGDA